MLAVGYLRLVGGRQNISICHFSFAIDDNGYADLDEGFAVPS